MKYTETHSVEGGYSHNFFTPLTEAVAEIQRRRADIELVRRVEDFLGSKIPKHFNQEKPILYLARHVATPNFETLRFIELAKPFDLPIVIGEDTKDKFVSNNSLKRSLGKMPVMKGTARNGDEITECFTIIHFDSAQGKPLSDIYTHFGEKLTSFHTRLFHEVYPKEVEIVDESAWVDTYRTNDLIEQYKYMFALLIVHGVMLEWYPPTEDRLVQNVVIPAFECITETFGVRPLIHELVPESLSDEKNWESYPSVVYPFVKKHYENRISSKDLCTESEALTHKQPV